MTVIDNSSSSSADVVVAVDERTMKKLCYGWEWEKFEVVCNKMKWKLEGYFSSLAWKCLLNRERRRKIAKLKIENHFQRMEMAKIDMKGGW